MAVDPTQNQVNLPILSRVFQPPQGGQRGTGVEASNNRRTSADFEEALRAEIVDDGTAHGAGFSRPISQVQTDPTAQRGSIIDFFV